MQIPLNSIAWIYIPYSVLVCLATTGVCILCASATVGALFYFAEDSECSMLKRRKKKAAVPQIKSQYMPFGKDYYFKKRRTNMGFFSLKNTDSTPIICAFCNKELGLNRYLIGKTESGKMLWKCPTCAKKGGFMKIVGEKAYFCDADGNLLGNPDYYEETYIKCNTCGHTYCYTQADIDENEKHEKAASRASAGAIFNVIGGTQFGAHASIAQADRELEKIVDFSKCPKCNSRNIRKLNKEEFEKEKSSSSAAPGTSSVADELKKFKELLDMGIITQEEFDRKKNQLLNL